MLECPDVQLPSSRLCQIIVCQINNYFWRRQKTTTGNLQTALPRIEKDQGRITSEDVLHPISMQQLLFQKNPNTARPVGFSSFSLTHFCYPSRLHFSRETIIQNPSSAPKFVLAAQGNEVKSKFLVPPHDESAGEKQAGEPATLARCQGEVLSVQHASAVRKQSRRTSKFGI